MRAEFCIFKSIAPGLKVNFYQFTSLMWTFVVASSSPCFLPASDSMDSEWPCHLAQRRRRGQCVYVLRTLIWEACGRKENTDRTAPAFGKCPAFLGFKELVMDRRVHRLSGTSRGVSGRARPLPDTLVCNFFFLPVYILQGWPDS